MKIALWLSKVDQLSIYSLIVSIDQLLIVAAAVAPAGATAMPALMPAGIAAAALERFPHI